MSTHRHITPTLAGAAIVCALAAPAASARPIEADHGKPSPPASATQPTVVRTIDSGFDVGSAAIGAGGAAAVLLLAAAAAGTASQRHRRVGIPG